MLLRSGSGIGTFAERDVEIAAYREHIVPHGGHVTRSTVVVHHAAVVRVVIYRIFLIAVGVVCDGLESRAERVEFERVVRREAHQRVVRCATRKRL